MLLEACPECGFSVETRQTLIEANYAASMVFHGKQVKLGPQHARSCKHWRKTEQR